MERFSIQLPATLLTVGQCVAREGWVHPERTLDSSVLIIAEHGRFTMRVGGQRRAVGPRQMLILPAGVPHWGEPAPDDDPPRYYWAHFLDGAPEERHRIELALTDEMLPEDTYNRAVTLFHQLINERSAGMNVPLAGDYLLSLLFLELTDERRGDPKAALFNRMREYIRLHCHERLTLAELSAAFGYSEDYLSRLFHANVRSSFRQYIHQLRLSRAKKELLSTVRSIQEIAADCGYSNAKFFSTVFLKYEGVTPSAYRNLYGGQHQTLE